MRRVRRLSRQRQFREGSHLNIAGPHSHVGDGDTTHLGIVFGGHDHLKSCGKRAVAPENFGAVFVKNGLIGVRFNAARLVAG